MCVLQGLDVLDPLNRVHQLGLKCILWIGRSSGVITPAKIGHSNSAGFLEILFTAGKNIERLVCQL